ncbi:MAG: AmmeMemoRadiSam system protein B [Planctomycetia bacterium]|nr:AmmeMemoRadiSam system protein B [Planctomycetia bacterium]
MKRPNLRNLELSPYGGPTQDLDGTIIPPSAEKDGKMTFILEDPEGFSPQLAIPTEMAILLTLFDGQHTQEEILTTFEELSGIKMEAKELAEIVEHFDQLYFLDSPRFAAFLKKEMDHFFQQENRPAMMAGGAYEKDPHMLRLQLENYIQIPKKIRTVENTPDPPYKKKGIQALITPHIDPERGAASYGWAYEALQKLNDSELFIILGTAHNPMRQPFTLTRKSFETPLGILPTDTDFIDKLHHLFLEKYNHICQEETISLQNKSDIKEAPDPFKDEFVHRDEHSIEFQTLFLQYALVCEKKRKVRIVPILINSCMRFFETGKEGQEKTPIYTSEIRALITALTTLIQEEEARTNKKVGIIATAEFSHIGPRYGSDPVDADARDLLKQEDIQLFTHILHGDTEGFWKTIFQKHNKNNVYSITTLFSFIELIKELGISLKDTGELLSYEQAVDEETLSCVTFGTLIF